jgi:hypothetical protein
MENCLQIAINLPKKHKSQLTQKQQNQIVEKRVNCVKGQHQVCTLQLCHRT